jgi:fatty-acyl-CoA synthase
MTLAAASNPYETGLDKDAANFVPPSPIGFLLRTAAVYPDRPAVVYGDRRCSWRQALERSRRLAAALSAQGVGRGDTVAVLAPNLPETFEAHFGVPMAGAVLNALNIRLDPETIAFILRHGEAKVLFADSEFAPLVGPALACLARKPLVVDICDPAEPGGARRGAIDYEAFLGSGDPNFVEILAEADWDAIALNYTSGTTGNPKGVVYHPPRRLSQRARQHPRLGHAAVPGLSLDLADVPLQRLVFPVDDHPVGRDPCLPAPGRAQSDLRDHRARAGDPSLRRPGGHEHAAECWAGADAPHRSAG